MTRSTRIAIVAVATLTLWCGGFFTAGALIGVDLGDRTVYGLESGLMVLGLAVAPLIVGGVIVPVAFAAADWIDRGHDAGGR